MIFIKLDVNKDIEFVHHMPFDSSYGLNKTKDELERMGKLVDSLPVPENNGMNHILKYDKTNDTFYYEYVDRILSPEEKIEQLEQDLGNVLLESAADKAKVTELEIAQGNLLMEIALLKGGNV